VSLGSRGDPSTAALVIARLPETERHMNKKMEERKGSSPERRAFFGQLFAAIGGGFLAGSLLRDLLSSQKRASNKEQTVSIITNPLAVPRTKEGSKSNV